MECLFVFIVSVRVELREGVLGVKGSLAVVLSRVVNSDRRRTLIGRLAPVVGRQERFPALLVALCGVA